MNIPPGFKFFNRKCPYCGIQISFINAFCVGCFNAVVIPERERQKAALEKNILKAKIKMVRS